jgi:hypothetical protein
MNPLAQPLPGLYLLFMSPVVPYLYFIPMSIVPGRIFSTLSFYFYSVVCSSGEFKKYFATPLRPPLPACSGNGEASLP